MATRDRVIHVPSDAYDRLEREAGRRGVQLDALATELLVAELAPANSDLDSILAALADVRSRVRGLSTPSLLFAKAAKNLSSAAFDGRSRRERCRGACARR